MSIHFNPPVSSDVHLTYTSQDGDHTMSNKEALSHWIKAGDIENFRSFFEGSPSLAELDTLREGFTVLHEAAKQKDPEFVAVVLQHLPDLVNAQDLWDTQTTPLMIAAANGNADTVRVLLEAEARPEAQDRQGWSALFWAVSRNAIDAIKVLLGYERSSEIAHPAPKAAQPEVIRSMLSCCDGNSRTALALAIQNQHWECAEVLLEAGANVGLHGSELQSAAEQAAEQGKMDLLSSIIAQAGPDLDGSSVLIFARFRDDEAAGLEKYRRTLDMLLASGADFGAPDRADSKSLLSAIKIRDFEVAKILIDAGIGLNGPPARGGGSGPERKKTPFEVVLQEGRMEIAARLANRAGFDVPPEYQRDMYRAYVEAASSGDVELFETLAIAGARMRQAHPNEVNPWPFPLSNGSEALDHATFSRMLAIYKAHGGDVDSVART